MRPTIDEHLAGTCRILEQVIAPRLTDPHTGAVLREVVRNLEQLRLGWDQVLPFLHWDNDRTAELLALAMDHVPAELAIRLLAESPAVDSTFDVEAVERHNELLRGLLSEVIGGLADTGGANGSDALRGRIIAHLEERSRRNPMRLVPQLPDPELPTAQGQES